jgi:hypothetical protein
LPASSNGDSKAITLGLLSILVGLLERKVIPHRLVGTHRRVAFADLIEYMRLDDQRRRSAMDEVTAISEELGED